VTLLSLAVLLTTGGLLVPQFRATRKQLRDHALAVDLDCLNQAVHRYVEEHGGALPGLEDGLINHDVLRRQLTLPSTSDGAITPSGPCGPYLKTGIPPNPWNDSSDIKVVTSPGLPSPDGTTGWVLHVPSNRIVSNARELER
jgi:hypothetical protein